MISLLPNLFKQALIYSVCLFKQVRSYKNGQSATCENPCKIMVLYIDVGGMFTF